MQNYQLNKQRLINDVQLSLDNAIETYYADLAKQSEYFNLILTDTLGSWSTDFGNAEIAWIDSSHAQALDSGRMDHLLDRLNIRRRSDSPRNNLRFNLNSGFVMQDTNMSIIDPGSISSLQIFRDSNRNTTGNFRNLANSMVFSMVKPMKMEEFGELLKTQLSEKGLDLDFGLQIEAFGRVIDEYNDPQNPRFVLATRPKSTYQFETRKLEMRFANASLTILRRGLTDLAISVLISITVIGALLYLYRIINQQKQLAEIKNDLISNITHEFKTPIATVASAIEGISNFNDQNDPEKTRKYLDISSSQLKKLNQMVEKLLETATLETDALQLNKNPLNLSQLMHTLIEKYRMVSGSKEIQFEDYANDAIVEADAFHLENALSNLIDNAVKYGGDQIKIVLAYQNDTVQVVVQDNGGFIEKSQKERVFDKFYRIPQGNQHDVKGFGIGLYYTRKIIEKHGGTIDLILGPGHTSFEVAI